jgi:hypothetical protein
MNEFGEYKSFVVEMNKYSVTIFAIKTNYELFYDFGRMPRLACDILMLEDVQCLSKFVKRSETFVCDFM